MGLIRNSRGAHRVPSERRRGRRGVSRSAIVLIGMVSGLATFGVAPAVASGASGVGECISQGGSLGAQQGRHTLHVSVTVVSLDTGESDISTINVGGSFSIKASANLYYGDNIPTTNGTNFTVTVGSESYKGQGGSGTGPSSIGPLTATAPGPLTIAINANSDSAFSPCSATASASMTLTVTGASPTVSRLKAVRAKAGASVGFRYTVADDGAETMEKIVVYRGKVGGKVVGRISTVWGEPGAAVVDWKLPRKVGRGSYQWCVTSFDRDGLASAQVCAALTVR